MFSAELEDTKTDSTISLTKKYNLDTSPFKQVQVERVFAVDGSGLDESENVFDTIDAAEEHLKKKEPQLRDSSIHIQEKSYGE